MLKKIYKNFNKSFVKETNIDTYLFMMFIKTFSEYNPKSEKFYKSLLSLLKSDTSGYDYLVKFKTILSKNKLFNDFDLQPVSNKNMLDFYNYFISESVKVDSLGYFYENCLMDNENRKSSGSYYTPKEIVSYMVSESFKAYQGNIFERLNVKDLDQVKQEGRLGEYVQLLKTITILDPACGGSVFLIEFYFHLLNHYTELGYNVDSNQIISNNLFGVDINPYAIKVSKLCFYILSSQKDFNSEYLFNFLCENTLMLSKEDLISKFELNRNVR